MLTIFAIPKPFRGHIGVIQRNAIRSWTLLRPSCHIILFGDDEGTAEVAREFGLHHVPRVRRNQYSTPLLNSIFDQAQQMVRHRMLAYVNADIILFSDFVSAVRRIPFRRFLMVGQRWDLNLETALNFSDPEWEIELRYRIRREALLQNRSAIDYFVFTPGLWGEIPPFAIGRTAWDTWLIYGARARAAPVVDSSEAITAVHQNHDYAHIKADSKEKAGTWETAWKGPEGQNNLSLAGGNYNRLFSLDDATWALPSRGLVRPVLSAERLKRHTNRLSSLPLPAWRLFLMREFFSLLLALKERRVTRLLARWASQVFSYHGSSRDT